MAHGDALPLDVRLANAALSIVAYLRDAFWPTRLAAFYPHPETQVSGAAPGSPRSRSPRSARSASGCARRQPGSGAVGWLWFLLLLAPTLGLVQVGVQARADRYTYLALTGLALALAVPVAGMGRRATAAAARLRGAAPCCSSPSVRSVARRQVEVWRDTETLFRHAAAVTEGNFLAEHAIGSELLRRGDAGAGASSTSPRRCACASSGRMRTSVSRMR